MGVCLAGVELDALCLDLDDTILDDSWSVAEAWDVVSALLSKRLRDVGREAVRAELARATDWFWGDDARHRRGRLDLLQARREIVGRVLLGLGREDARLADEAARLYTDLRERALRPLEGALEALAALRAALPRLALVTNGAAAPQRAKIERFGLASFFDHVQVEGEFGAGKPDAVVWAHVLERLGSGAARTLMVGDNYECDVLGPLEAGLHAAWLEPTGERAPPCPSPRPHLRLRSLAELVARLER
jgi:putative hydrolase of the HAD superfamily